MFQLDHPRNFTITPCEYDLIGSDVFYDDYPAYYFPTDKSPISEIFFLGNQVHGYQYEPGGLSPIPIPQRYQVRKIARDQFVCQSPLWYAAGGWIYQSNLMTDPTHVTIRKLPDGSFLLKSGPDIGTMSPFGTGQCGSCPTVGFAIARLSPSRGVELALALGYEPQGNGPLMDVEIQLSSDWKTVTVYTSNDDPQLGTQAWSSQRYCFTGTKYVDCGPGPAGAPPKPRQVRLSNN